MKVTYKVFILRSVETIDEFDDIFSNNPIILFLVACIETHVIFVMYYFSYICIEFALWGVISIIKVVE